ncbi:MAG: ABC-type antimicrobial peptide transport system, permease component [halophilic archaeon J07HX5]|jgi:ABC-type antimicrobial peptide transport system, permease component|nr:MAG: ABC-type antimicrobial peptide transport system, permease component [halophilic archaeon J07HX5]
MKLRDSLRLAGRSLTGHRLRSALTVVGIVIGIATVVIFASFGTSVQTDVVGEFEDTSASEIFVVSGDLEVGEFGGGGGNSFNLNQIGDFARPAVTTTDIEALRELDGVNSVILRGEVEVNELTHKNNTLLLGDMTTTTPNAFLEDDFVAGEAFEQGTEGEGEIVLSKSAAEQFESNVTVGETVELDYEGGPEEFTVVGITTSARGGFANFGPTVYAPVDPYYEEYGETAESPSQRVEQTAFRQVTLTADPNSVVDVQTEIEQYLEQESDARQILPDDVGLTVQSTADIVDGIESVLNDIIRLVSGIGLLALIVGAFGIANIMLVSVTERTKEIGIMKSTGARNREVMGLFLGEAVLLGIVGAVIGIPVGLAVGYGAAAYAEVGFTIPLGWIAGAALMGIGTGIIAGLYPAWRAARVDPIDALRYE